MKKNNIIHEFDTKIYPFKIYIVCNPNCELPMSL